jgi:uncharacterized phosphosugar-binding protein
MRHFSGDAVMALSKIEVEFCALVDAYACFLG